MSKTVLTYDPNLFKHQFLETSSFTVVFAKHRLEYIRSIEKYIKTACNVNKIKYEVNYDETTMEVLTTPETRDPYMIIKADDMIQLLSKGVPLEYASKVLHDDIFSEIIPVNLLCAGEKVFERRKNRINNPKTLKAIELLTKCKIFISGKVACVIGNYKGLNEAKSILIACFENIHPVFEIKKLIIRHKLEKEGKEGDWEHYMPEIKKTHSKKREKGREAGNIPEDIKPRKEDIARETGEYYADNKNIEKDKAREERRQKRNQIRQTRLEKHTVPNE